MTRSPDRAAQDERMLDALEAFHSRDFVGALFKLQRLEQEGYRHATLYIANMYERGYPGVPRDLRKAVQLYDALAEENDPRAVAALANLYYEGLGVPQDYTRAGGLYGRLAHVGQAHAQFMLADMYARGLGLDRDLETAFLWFKSSAEGGNLYAMWNVGLLRVGRGEWGGIFTLLKAAVFIAFLRLFHSQSPRLQRR